jgi:hypothetical protein
MSRSSLALSNLRAIVMLAVRRIPFGALVIGVPRRAVATP